jgi:signal peptidase II
MQTPGRKGLAVTNRAGHLRLWVTVAIGLAVDLATKYLSWNFLGGPLNPVHPDAGGRQVDLISGWLSLVAIENHGIVFGLSFTGMFGVLGARVLTVLLTLITLGLIFYVFASSLARQKWLHVWCGLVMAGALGNLYDRLLFGYVRDLIQITAHGTIGGVELSWPYIFNVADIYLVVGVAAVALAFLLASRHPPVPPAAPPRKGA